MVKSQIKLYYKNVTAEVIGQKHGITNAQLDKLADKTSKLILKLNEERKAGKTPYRDLPYNKQTIQQVKDLAGKLKNRCNNLVIFGIGGSALGNIALQTALNPYMYNLNNTQRNGPRLFVFDNIDPDQLGSFLDWLDKSLENTIFNFISKSGRTVETASQFLIIRKLLHKRLGSTHYKKQVVATTDQTEGTLRTIANKDELSCLEIPKGVGGRFSVLSAVGLFSACMCGIDIDALLQGARAMDKKVSRTDFYKNPAAINAAINYHFYNNGKKISVLFPYSFALRDLADWYRQLWAESLGKAKDLAGNKVHIGPTPVKALGATDQHSQLQLYREGPNDKLFTFLQVSDFYKDLKIGPVPACAPELGFLVGKNLSFLLNCEKQATEYALLRDKRPCLTVLFSQINPYTVGQFIYLFEVTTSLAGALFNLNTYNQPAIELAKVAAFALMEKPGFYRPGYSHRRFAKDIRTLTNLDRKFLV